MYWWCQISAVSQLSSTEAGRSQPGILQVSPHTLCSVQHTGAVSHLGTFLSETSTITSSNKSSIGQILFAKADIVYRCRSIAKSYLS